MLLLLGAFAIVPLVLPWLVRHIGARAFYVAALLPIAAFIQAAAATPAVLAGAYPFESYDWITPLGIELSMRMNTAGTSVARTRVSGSSPRCCSPSRERCTDSSSPTTSSCW
jgi:hypothetical protein